VDDHLIYSKLNSKIFPNPTNLILEIKEYLK
jgi:hypothetical protein